MKKQSKNANGLAPKIILYLGMPIVGEV